MRFHRRQLCLLVFKIFRKIPVFATPERSAAANDKILETPATEPQGGNMGNAGFDEEEVEKSVLSPIAEESDVVDGATVERQLSAKPCNPKKSAFA